MKKIISVFFVLVFLVSCNDSNNLENNVGEIEENKKIEVVISSRVGGGRSSSHHKSSPVRIKAYGWEYEKNYLKKKNKRR